MAKQENKMMMSTADIAGVQKVYSGAVEDFLQAERKRANVVGLGIGKKWRNGEPTGENALVVLVAQKLEKSELLEADLIPTRWGDVATDVLAIGYPMAGGHHMGGCTCKGGVCACHEAGGAGSCQCMEMGQAVGRRQAAEAGIQTLTRRIRPAKGGYSVGHKNITAGTIGTCVYDILPGGSTNPPAHGIGIPPRYYILSNNHVLANSNAAALGDAVLQPGPFDGGIDPADRVATLSRFVPITFEPPVPRLLHRNIIDAAIAVGQFHDLDREVHWSGPVRGWRRKASVTVGTLVKKTGRTTNFTTGRITAVNATVDVGYGGGRVARFTDQIITTAMSAGGDSGSLITTLDNVAVGLLYAGSSIVTIANQIENVRSLLRVEVAEQIL